MTDQEVEDIKNSLFPVGQERWIRVKYYDRDKAIKILWMPMDEKRAEPYVEKHGFYVTAIGVRDEYIPQVSALMDLKGEVIGCLHGNVQDSILNHINDLFKNRIDDIKRYTIKTPEDLEIKEPKPKPEVWGIRKLQELGVPEIHIQLTGVKARDGSDKSMNMRLMVDDLVNHKYDGDFLSKVNMVIQSLAKLIENPHEEIPDSSN